MDCSKPTGLLVDATQGLPLTANPLPIDYQRDYCSQQSQVRHLLTWRAGCSRWWSLPSRVHSMIGGTRGFHQAFDGIWKAGSQITCSATRRNPRTSSSPLPCPRFPVTQCTYISPSSSTPVAQTDQCLPMSKMLNAHKRGWGGKYQ
jgi:hypothetical protein